MENVALVLRALLNLMTGWLTLLMLWQLAVSLFGYRKNAKTYQDHQPQMRFLILVPAHNEEVVIGDIIRNLSHMDYPRELYDFYILADNCTDRTAEVARSLGAQVLEFHRESEDSPTGKPIALQKALNALHGYQEQYDLVMFFDADNLIDRNLFAEVNSQYVDAQGKADIIQCYLGAKNRRGLVAMFYYMSYTITNRFFQFAKDRMGLNCVVGGTGFAVSAKYLHERGGWTAMSLTEDFELQVAATCEGRRILWNHTVRIYDEKPTSFRASFRQRVRWAQGHWFVAFRNTRRLFAALWHRHIGFGEFFSTFLYLYSLTPAVFLVIQAFLRGLLQVFVWAGWISPHAPAAPFGWMILEIPGILLFFYCFIFLFYLAEWMDNHIRFDIKTVLPMLCSLLVNTLVASWAQVVGLAKHRRQSQWVKTDHSMNHSEELTVRPSDVGLSDFKDSGGSLDV